MMKSEKYKYNFLRYNKYHVLRPNALLVLILAFLCKDIIFLIIIGAGSFKGGTAPGISGLTNLINPKMIISDLPAIGVVFSLINRNPDAGRFIRFLWKYGRVMIALSIIIHIMLILLQINFQFLHLGLFELILIGIDLSAIAYVLLSKLTQDIFAEFPEIP